MCVLALINWICQKKRIKSDDVMGSSLCWELQRDMSVSSRLFEVCERAGICSYREVKSALQSLQEKGRLGLRWRE